MAAIPAQNPPGGASPVLAQLRALYARRETIRYLTASNLKAGHRDKALGHLWNLLDPLGLMLVYYVVFGILFGQASGGRSIDFMLYIFVGLLSWRFFSASLSQAATCIRGARGLIHEINFPKGVFPVSLSLANLYDFLWGLLVLILIMLLTGHPASLHWIWLPLLIAVQLLLTAGLAFTVASLGAFFADMTNVLNVVLRFGFYCTPIVYYVRGPQGRIPDGPRHADILFYYMLNPVSCLLECYRDALLYSRLPDAGYAGYALLFALGALLCGLWVFSRFEGQFVKYV